MTLSFNPSDPHNDVGEHFPPPPEYSSAADSPGVNILFSPSKVYNRTFPCFPSLGFAYFSCLHSSLYCIYVLLTIVTNSILSMQPVNLTLTVCCLFFIYGMIFLFGGFYWTYKKSRRGFKVLLVLHPLYIVTDIVYYLLSLNNNLSTQLQHEILKRINNNKILFTFIGVICFLHVLKEFLSYINYRRVFKHVCKKPFYIKQQTSL
ncbi:hypothetical protein HMI54_004626 [Coelomomyces lativittatus]|nr:hypothetical protein HMI54_004626 [Coelomomyces lativittatus]KAJ1507515.1 hypothetical protein HMI55_000746 [Coelomomyces lativittatus]KAJ1509391.1 hypothetical protein HMI56_006825 [Coelomomyces lativittatus]